MVDNLWLRVNLAPLICERVTTSGTEMAAKAPSTLKQLLWHVVNDLGVGSGMSEAVEACAGPGSINPGSAGTTYLDRLTNSFMGFVVR